MCIRTLHRNRVERIILQLKFAFVYKKNGHKTLRWGLLLAIFDFAFISLQAYFSILHYTTTVNTLGHSTLWFLKCDKIDKMEGIIEHVRMFFKYTQMIIRFWLCLRMQNITLFKGWTICDLMSFFHSLWIITTVVVSILVCCLSCYFIELWYLFRKQVIFILYFSLCETCVLKNKGMRF